MERRKRTALFYFATIVWNERRISIDRAELRPRGRSGAAGGRARAVRRRRGVWSGFRWRPRRGACWRRPVVADRDQPPFARATRDGFACRAADLQAGGLRVVGQLRAGEAWTLGAIRPGEAAEIMTGATVPAGADCVVMVEHVSAQGGVVRPCGGAGDRAGGKHRASRRGGAGRERLWLRQGSAWA